MTPQELDDIARQVRRRRRPPLPSASPILYLVEEGVCPICGASVRFRLDGHARHGIEDPNGRPHACAASTRTRDHGRP